MNIGEKIKELRKEKGITQVELADAIGVTKDTVSLWERGRVNPSRWSCTALADYFEVSLDEICDMAIEKVRAEAIKEFADRLREEVIKGCCRKDFLVTIAIDNLVKEMVGSRNEV